MTKKQILSLVCIFILGCGLLLTASLAKKHRKAVEWDGNPYNIENVNAFDRKLAQPYNGTLDTIGDFGVMLAGGMVALVVVVAFFTSLSKDKLKAFKVAVLDSIYFGISGMYANSIYRILKTIAGRIRPYMYFANPSEKGIAEGDFFRSWPSGHSANALITFGFLLSWFAVRYADSKLKKPVLTVSFLICLSTMILRLLSGNHFLTDVLTGAALGFVLSYSVSQLCYRIYGKEKEIK
jgi:undecaprenyl-diphosphatase